jgi:hypothetical protein
MSPWGTERRARARRIDAEPHAALETIDEPAEGFAAVTVRVRERVMPCSTAAAEGWDEA